MPGIHEDKIKTQGPGKDSGYFVSYHLWKANVFFRLLFPSHGRKAEKQTAWTKSRI